MFERNLKLICVAATGYDNIDIEGTSDIDIITPILDIDVSDKVTIDATNSVSINTAEYNLTGTTTNMEGDTLNVDYKNIDVDASESLKFDLDSYLKKVPFDTNHNLISRDILVVYTEQIFYYIFNRVLRNSIT